MNTIESKPGPMSNGSGETPRNENTGNYTGTAAPSNAPRFFTVRGRPGLLLPWPPEFGLHQGAFIVVLKCRSAGINDEDELAGILREWGNNDRRGLADHEIADAIRNSDPDCARQDGTQARGSGNSSTPPRSKWPKPDGQLRQRIGRHGPSLNELAGLSPVPCGSDRSRAEWYIDRLFPGNPLLCFGLSNSNFETDTREAWRGQLPRQQLIVPSPMSALTGRKKNPMPGKKAWSFHTLDNTGPRRFLVIEFDTGSFDEHAALLWHLAKVAPLALAVHSGGKSLHGWFFCAGQPEAKLLRFMQFAVSIGADPATWTRSQFVRMPDGRRDNGKRQTVIYFNPEVIR